MQKEQRMKGLASKTGTKLHLALFTSIAQLVEEQRLGADIFPAGVALEEGENGANLVLREQAGVNTRRKVDHLVGLLVEFRLQLAHDREQIVGQFRPRLGQRDVDLIHEFRNDDLKRA